MEIEKAILEKQIEINNYIRRLNVSKNVDYVEVEYCERYCAMFDFYFIKYLFVNRYHNQVSAITDQGYKSVILI